MTFDPGVVSSASRGQVAYIARFSRVAARPFASLLLGCVCLAAGCDRAFDTETPKTPELLPSTHSNSTAGVGLNPGDVDPPPPRAELPTRSPAEIIAGFKQLKPHQVDDSQLHELAALEEAPAEITSLNCSGSRITDAGLAHISKLTGLVELKVDSTRITPAGVKALAQLPELQTLSIGGVPLPETQLENFDAGLEILGGMQQLTDLDLSGARINDAALSPVGNLQNLKRLALNDTSVTDAALAHLSGLLELEVLEISRTQITDAGFAALTPLNELHTLLMSETKISGAGFSQLAKRNRKNGFRVVDASVSNFGLQGLIGLRGSKSIEVLYLNGAGVSDQTLIALKGCTNLRELQLSGNPEITSLGIRNLGGLKNLETLGLNNVQRVTDQALGVFRQHKKLRQLGLNNTSCTLPGIQQLKNLLPDLKVVYAGQEI